MPSEVIPFIGKKDCVDVIRKFLIQDRTIWTIILYEFPVDPGLLVGENISVFCSHVDIVYSIKKENLFAIVESKRMDIVSNDEEEEAEEDEIGKLLEVDSLEAFFLREGSTSLFSLQ